jgi:hypothetical protein
MEKEEIKIQQKEDKPKKKSNTSKSFVIALSVVSIISFLSIILESLFYVNINEYVETLWLATLGIGLILETSIKELKKIKKGLNSELLGKLIMVIIGSIALIAGILSLPQINIQIPSFLAVKGIISILAVLLIIIQTWITKRD